MKKNNYKFTDEELEEVARIVSQKSIDEAQRQFGFCGDQFLSLRKTNAKLDEAIKKGQEIRHRLQNKQLYEELDRFSSFSEEEVEKIKQIASQKAGIKVIQFEYKISKRTLEHLRQKLPNIAKAINEGLYLRKQKSKTIEETIKKDNKPKAKNISKPIKVRKGNLDYQLELKIRVNNHYESPDAALEKYRKLVEERKLEGVRRRFENGEFKSMISF